MPHDLIDNQNIKLVDALKQTLPGSAAAHFAIGYLDAMTVSADR